MRVITQEVKLFTFDELSDKAKDYVMSQMAPDHDWWYYILEEAKDLGLKINTFDFRGGMSSEWVGDPEICARLIIKDHGEMCDTYKEAKAYLNQLKTGEEDNREELDKEFRYALQECYYSMLMKEYDYLTSEECIRETCEANEYEFTEDGSMF